MFIPTTADELKNLGWKNCDIIIVSGDTYIDSPFSGAALIGKILIANGFKVGIIAQPDIQSEKDIASLGEPNLFWAVTAGCMDSMVANYTATGKRRKNDDLTPGEINNKRPDRASIVYTNLIKKYFKKSAPIVLGGVEASLRRAVHYDFWSDSLKKSILIDSEADYLLFQMADKSVVELAKAIQSKNIPLIKKIRGLCYKIKENEIGEVDANFIQLPSYDEINKDESKNLFIDFFKTFYANSRNPYESKTLIQKQDRTRFVVINPDPLPLSQSEIDKIYSLEFERSVHPKYLKMGRVKAQETIATSITTHRGCFGECNFCSIAIHQSPIIVSRSINSVVEEAKKIASQKDFKGYISNVGGATANMYKTSCKKFKTNGSCKSKRCLFPIACENISHGHSEQTKLLTAVASIRGVKKAFVASGIRYDLINADTVYGNKYLKQIIEKHTSGQMKIAPEHTEKKVLLLMGKPDSSSLVQFKKKFDLIAKKEFLTYYIIAGHPGCDEKNMNALQQFCQNTLKTNPEQIQIFTPLPSTWSSVMFYTGKNPFSNEREVIFVEKSTKGREIQKEIIFKDYARSKKVR